MLEPADKLSWLVATLETTEYLVEYRVTLEKLINNTKRRAYFRLPLLEIHRF